MSRLLPAAALAALLGALARRMGEAAEAQAKVYELAKPQPRKFEIVPAK